MKSRLLTLLLVSLCIMPGPALATELDTSWYMSLAFGAMKYQQENLEDFEMDDYRLVIGKQLNRVFAVEAHAGTGSEDTQPVYGLPVTLSIDYYVAGFAKANYTHAWENKSLRLYGMLGGTYVESTSSDPVLSRSGSQGSLSAGVGLEMFADNIGIQLGYTRYVNESNNNNDYSLDSLHLGFVYYFADMIE